MSKVKITLEGFKDYLESKGSWNSQYIMIRWANKTCYLISSYSFETKKHYVGWSFEVDEIFTLENGEIKVKSEIIIPKVKRLGEKSLKNLVYSSGSQPGERIMEDVHPCWTKFWPPVWDIYSASLDEYNHRKVSKIIQHKNKALGLVRPDENGFHRFSYTSRNYLYPCSYHPIICKTLSIKELDDVKITRSLFDLRTRKILKVSHLSNKENGKVVEYSNNYDCILKMFKFHMNLDYFTTISRCNFNNLAYQYQKARKPHIRLTRTSAFISNSVSTWK